MRIKHLRRFVLSTVFFTAIQSAWAQANLPIYTDNLVNGFQNWSWATVNLANSSPTHSGSHSISVVNGGNYQALYLEHANFNTAPYASLSFWINGGPGGGQTVSVHGLLNGSSQGGHSVGPLAANTWQQVTFSLSTLGINNKSNCSGIWIQGASASAQPAFYVDDIQFNAAPAPALVHLNVNANSTVRTADARWFGLNTAVWDSTFDTTSTSNALKEMGCLTLRFPGGSLSDEYHWGTGKSLDYTWAWATSWANFMHVATNAGVQAFITVNYGTGTSNEAAGWVKSANITNHCGFKYWEIGNECYGGWETDSNNVAHDPYTYAVRAAGYIALMKQADPTIKIGVVAVPGEDSYANNTSHPATNPRTGLTHNGWTPVMLTTLKNLGITPDYLVHHVYPEYTGTESDPLVLQASGNWALDAVDLRQQLSDYLGANGSNVELVCTENNSNSGQQGRQSTSIVNGLYLADSLSQLMKTEINAFIWWDLRNGSDTSGSFDPTLYGWRTVGDLGIMSGTSTKYPTYYGMKMMQYLARPGDTVLNPTSDYLLLSSYAALQTNGNLALLVINKDSVTNLTGQIALSNFTPASTATVRSFGIQQDEATRTNGPAALKDIQTNSVSASATFNHTFPPYSMTLFTFTPAAAAPIPTTVSLVSGANPSTYGDAVSFTATVRTNGVAVGGIGGQSVAFYNGTVQLGTGTLNSGGQAGYTTTPSQLAAGTRSITARYAGDATYSGSTNSPALSQTVDPAGLTVSGVTAQSKVYDGTTDAQLSGTPTLNGVVSGDDVSLVTGSVIATFSDPNVGTSIPVTVGGYTLSGTDMDNYTLAQPAGLTADILPLVTPVFGSPALSSGAGGWQLSFSAQSGQDYRVLATSDLTQPVNLWTVLTNGTFGAGTVTITDPATNLPARFYLIVSP